MTPPPLTDFLDESGEDPHPANAHRYITTYSGVNVGPPETFCTTDVRIRDIARSLAMTCRFYGHLSEFYSVAEHSVLVSRMARLNGEPVPVIRAALLHDAHEAYCGDMAAPQKPMVFGAKQFERGYQDVVRAAFDLPPDDDPCWRRIHEYDVQLLHREVKNLRNDSYLDPEYPQPPLPDWFDPDLERRVHQHVQPLGHPWRYAESQFLSHFRVYSRC